MTEPKLLAGRTAADTRLTIHVKPRASRSRLVGWRQGQLEVAVAAPPVDGEANLELTRTLAAALRLRRSDVEVIAGARGRHKTVLLYGCTPATIEARIAAALDSVQKGQTKTGSR